MYKLCVFDMDGTIINTIDSLAFFGNKALESMGFAPIETEVYKKLVGNGVYTLIERILIYVNAENSSENRKKLYEEYSRLYEKDPFYLVSPYDGITKLLQDLKANGIKLAVLSNKPHKLTTFIADKFFPNVFDLVQGQIDDIPHKPHPKSLLNILEHFDVQKSDVLYCGDSDVDMQTAKNAEVTAAGVLWGFRPREELAENGAEILAKEPNDLYLAAMNT